MPVKRRAILWFRQDLRLHDNEALQDALAQAFEVVPVYVFDLRVFKGTTELGLPKTGYFRAKFILESVIELKRALKKLGSDLIIRIGHPEAEIAQLAQQVRSSWVFCNRERTPEEVYVQDQLEQNLWSIGQELRFSRGKMLYHTGDLPFPIQHTPDTFAQFKKEVERYVNIRTPLPPPRQQFNLISTPIDPGIIPNISDLVEKKSDTEPINENYFPGGAAAGWQRMQAYFSQVAAVKAYKRTKDELSGTAISTRLSPYLAQGCLSPKQVYAAMQQFKARHGAHKSLDELFHQLMYRDFLRFTVKKHGAAVFEAGGVKGKPLDKLSDDMRRFQKWAHAQTGQLLIDAGIRELRQTGYVSNRMRQNLAAYLVHELEVNWQWGASFFESLLVDYDVCSNWMNWNAIAGLTHDPKAETVLDPEAQMEKYDPDATYINQWAGMNQEGDSAKPPLSLLDV